MSKTVASVVFCAMIGSFGPFSIAFGAPPKEMATLAESGLSAFFSPTGKHVAFKWDNTKLGLMPSQLKARPTLQGDYGLAAFTGDGKQLAAVAFDRQLHFIDTASGRVVRKTPIPFGNSPPAVEGLAVSPDAKHVAAKVLVSGVLAFSAATGEKYPDLEDCGAAHLNFNKAGALIGADGNGRIGVWNVATGKREKSWNVCQRGIEACAFTADHGVAAAGEADTGIVRLWSLAEEKEVGQLQNLKFIKSIAITGDGKKLAVACSEPNARAVRLWDLATQAELEGIGNLPTRPLCVSFSPDGKYLLVATESNFDSTVKAATKLYSIP